MLYSDGMGLGIGQIRHVGLGSAGDVFYAPQGEVGRPLLQSGCLWAARARYRTSTHSNSGGLPLSWAGGHRNTVIAASVKDYRTPATELGLTD
jgi:hypothetical protein